MRWGVDTDRSTPQFSLNIHSFLGWFTRATTRGTWNSCLASSEITRLSSSSPVAATRQSARATRSEEHTSELQSRLHLVCRLLLEKKKKNKQHKTTDNHITNTRDTI